MKEKQKRKFTLVHIIWGIIATAVLIPLSFFLYVLVINPMQRAQETRIVSSMAKEDINEYFAALSEQDYERAADYIYIHEKVDDHTYIEGSREEWIERMEQLEESDIIFQYVQDVTAHSKDGCVRSVDFEVVIDANGTPLIFGGRAIPLSAVSYMKCPSVDSYESLRIRYDPYLSSPEFWDAVIEQAYSAGGLDKATFDQYKAMEISVTDIIVLDKIDDVDRYMGEVSRKTKSIPEIDQVKFAISSELVRE